MQAFTRLSSGLDPTLIRELMNPTVQRDFRLFFRPLMAINRAHVVMLAEQGIINRQDAAAILRGVVALEQEMRASTLREGLDLYFNVERALLEKVGPVGGRMHTGRSRNDLQAGYQRMAVRETVVGLAEDVVGLRTALIEVAAGHVESVMPGYTHGQAAQPVTFGHYLVGVHDAFARDFERLVAAWHRTNFSPLGAGALATTGFPIDRQRVAGLLGFEGLIENSIDAVASRDYLIEALAACVGVTSTASRTSADLINWSAYEYRFVEIADGYASGSSIMPQKKNPLALEHTRAKLAQVLAAYTSVVALTKGLPFTHSRDTGSEAFHLSFDGFDETGLTARVLAAVIATLTVHVERMAVAAEGGYATATELADTLVRRCDLPFRVAHEIVGAVVARAVRDERPVRAWTLDDIRAAAAEHSADVSALTADDVRAALEPERNVAVRAVTGGPAPSEVSRMIEARRRELDEARGVVGELRARVARANEALDEEVRKLVG